MTLQRRHLSRYRNEHGELWVNVASSRLTLAGFVNLDRSMFLAAASLPPAIDRFLAPRHAVVVDRLRQSADRAPLVWFDCRRPLPFDTGTVDHILCSHYLEHVPPATADRMLRDYARALRSGGTLHLVLPDLRYAVDRYVRGETDADELLRWQHLRNHDGMRRSVRVLDAAVG
nr:class I SAM-dependent methyltransferase [Micromonospora sp. DSM 115978]